MSIKITSEMTGVDEALELFERMPERTRKATQLAINQTITRKGMRLIQDTMTDQIAFPKGYLTGNRLQVTKYAKESDLEGVITARKRATSLARFAAPGTPIGSHRRAGVRVAVKSGGSTQLRNAWLVRLKKGASLTEDQFNIGLAVRVNTGESLAGKSSEHNSWLVEGVIALLYGPSVDQVFRDVAQDVSEPIGDLLAAEFFRQFERLA